MKSRGVAKGLACGTRPPQASPLDDLDAWKQQIGCVSSKTTAYLIAKAHPRFTAATVEPLMREEKGQEKVTATSGTVERQE